MKSSAKRADRRACVMTDIIANVVRNVTGVTQEELRSKSCAHKVTKARFIFVELCNGVVSPASLIADYLNKDMSMISYYKKSHNECYGLYKDFREMSDESDRLLTELLTKINGTFENVFQEEGE
jgi:hypothetical protein